MQSFQSGKPSVFGVVQTDVGKAFVTGNYIIGQTAFNLP